LAKTDQTFFNGFIVIACSLGEGALKAVMLAIMVLEKTDEIIQVIRIEGPVFEISKLF
jgi:hypothetical protein